MIAISERPHDDRSSITAVIPSFQVDDIRQLIPSGSDSFLIMREGMLCVVRPPKPESKLGPIIEEYAGIGFTTRYGGELRLRNVAEQVEFLVACRKRDLPVVMPLEMDSQDRLIFPFIRGVSYADLLGDPTCSQSELSRAIETI